MQRLIAVGLLLACALTLKAQSAGPLIVIAGPPLSGKTTQIALLEKEYGIPTIAADDLIRANANELKKSMRPGQTMADMRFDPSLSRFLRNKLKEMNIASGIALDGFPATRFQGEDLKKMITDFGFSKLVVVRLNIPDEVVRKRAESSGRQLDTGEHLEQRLKDYHREFDGIRAIFPNVPLIELDATQSEDRVTAQVRAALAAAGIQPQKR